MSSVVDIREGYTAETFLRRSDGKGVEHLCFSVITPDRTLDLQALDMNTKGKWLLALRFALDFLRLPTPEEVRKTYEDNIAMNKEIEERDRLRSEKKKRLEEFKTKYTSSGSIIP